MTPADGGFGDMIVGNPPRHVDVGLGHHRVAECPLTPVEYSGTVKSL